MSMNLHGIVRGAITTVNPDFPGTWRMSTGFTQDATGRPLPAYTDVAAQMQVQALSAQDLKHEDFISQQGLKRAVYMYSDAQGVDRPDAKGGDLLLFPQVSGGANRVWLVVKVLETWTPDAAGWCKVGVVLQPDAIA